MITRMELGPASYDIVLERGCLGRAGELLDLNRKVMIVTGELMPRIYAEAVAQQCSEPFIHTIPSGEDGKCIPVWEDVLAAVRIFFHWCCQPIIHNHRISRRISFRKP